MITEKEQPYIITMGDPAGIGPEIIVKSVIDGQFDMLLNQIVVAGDVAILQRAAKVLGVIETDRTNGVHGEVILAIGSRKMRVQPLSNLDPATIPFGEISAECGQAMLDYIEWACEQCRTGHGRAMITAPIQKEAIRAAGCEFPGHTELLAERCGVDKVVMMLGGTRLKVCLVTTHLALSDVPAAVTGEEIDATLRVTDAAFRQHFTHKAPRIAVLALNPHAGEGGMFGDEEQRIIAPAIARAKVAGMDVSGPHSADTLFHFAVQGEYDAVVCMYHDQGLIPLKLLHFEDGVNVTLGLPIIRTSVDHGTAYDLAGTGQASAESLIAAVQMATQMSNSGQQ